MKRRKKPFIEGAVYVEPAGYFPKEILERFDQEEGREAGEAPADPKGEKSGAPAKDGEAGAQADPGARRGAVLKGTGPSMKVAVMRFRLYAPWVHSLKEKRSISRSLLSRLRDRFGVSAAEVDEQDAHPFLVIGVAAVVPHSALADSLMEEVSAFVEANTDAEILEETREIR